MKTTLQRLGRNLSRLPSRTWLTMWRRWQRVYQLERKADRVVPRLFGRARVKEFEAIPGRSSPYEGRLLAYLAMQSPPGGVFVEIGAFKGRSTAWIVEAAGHHAARPTVVSIDPHLGDDWHPQTTWPDFKATVQRFEMDRRGLEVRRDLSRNVAAAWDRPIAFLWIDGSHEFQDVADDIEGFVPYVIPGGWVIFDDATDPNWPGVWQAIEERMLPRTDFEYLGLVRHFALFRRKSARAA
jgi:predicted O-methyltransferase YrrM